MYAKREDHERGHGRLEALKKALIERALDAELPRHSGCPPNAA
ncbi:hypothetical protein [Variovorax saccharolyticus]|nr:hypothetical protein [Variovorax sp. J31P216]MDM0030351.1 hypothetical protein [Variovorax sp. J31P216]